MRRRSSVRSTYRGPVTPVPGGQPSGARAHRLASAQASARKPARSTASTPEGSPANAYLPSNLGSRFCTKALMASAVSAVPKFTVWQRPSSSSA